MSRRLPAAAEPPQHVTGIPLVPGTFGPRRIDAKSGKRFTLTKGQSISRRVGIYVHRGDAEEAKVAEIYQRYVKGEL